ncbi:MAG: bifunctional 4-hydroxy-2-oxoglutarate aldolase/2-dehydro-3-deoxy-phosphogluconate aldolase [Phototrophicaceae bacterium]|jgi:2-dehydro-3-deoxyphosphogluconate aldolase/(4S)-4-hydroxy-2-oxoglutarate aldolase
MAQHSRLNVYQAMLQQRVIPLFYSPNAATAQTVVNTCVRGNAAVIEFTNRGDGALDVFAELRRSSDAILGIGTIVDAPTAAIAIAHGADFIVSPSFNPDVAKLCNRRKVAYLPGCMTPTEISQAEELGVEIVKLFPNTAINGQAFIKALLAPAPYSLIMPSGGVLAERQNLHDWFKAGACCVGMGSNLIPAQALADGNMTVIQDTLAQVLAWAQEVPTHV